MGQITLLLKSGHTLCAFSLPVNNTEDDNMDLRKVKKELQEHVN